VAAEIEKELRVNHESLTAVRTTENRCLVLQPIFRSLDRTFEVLHQANAALSECGAVQPAELQAMKRLLDNYSGTINSYGQAAWSLQSRTSRIAAHITDTLSFKDAYIAKRQTEFMLRDSTTVRVITVVTLIYLPATFTATLLGMNSFFEMDDNRRIVVSPQFWIYIVCAVPLTVATLSYWWYFQKAKQRGERSMNGAISGAMMV
jgi:Mg2+ and Co2+ transporter CorA